MKTEAKKVNMFPIEDLETVVIDSAIIERVIEAATGKGYVISIEYARVGDTEHAQMRIEPANKD